MTAYACTILTTAEATVLDLTTANGYILKSLTLPALSRRREAVASPDAAGDVERQSVLDAAILEMVVSVRGTSDSDAWGNYDDLYNAAAAGAARFKIRTTMRGRVDLWTANRATAWALNGDPQLLRNRHLEVTVRVPVQPSPTTTYPT